MDKIKDLEEYIKKNSHQNIIELKEKHPVIHFSESARDIFMNGFKYGAKKIDIDGTFDLSKKTESGNVIKNKDSEGINYAFDTLSYSFENNCLDYEYGIENGMGMYEDSAIICLADVIKTTHPENFDQCLFYGSDVELKTMIILKNEGLAMDENGQPEYDENGNEYDSWSAFSKIEGHLVRKDDNLNLEDCVATSLKKMIEKNRYPNKINNDFNHMYSEFVSLPSENNDILSMEVAKSIAYKIRDEINDEYNLNYDFVDYCDLFAEKVSEVLINKGYYDAEIINGFYHHSFEDSELDAYGHHWVECDGIIIDPSRTQFDSNEYVQRKEYSKNHKMTDEINTKNKTQLKNKI